MTKFSLLNSLLVVVTSTALMAQVHAPLQQVTVFPNGAILEHNTSLNLKKGEQTLIIKGLASQVDANSFLVEVDNYVTLMSYRFIKDFKTKPSDVKTSDLDLKIKAYQKKVQNIDQQVAIENQSLSLILENKRTTGENANLDVKLLDAYVNYYKEQAQKIYTNLQTLTEQQSAYKDSITSLQKQISALQEDPMKNMGTLELVLQAPEAGTSQVKFSYYTPYASWVPTYDVLCEQIEQPLKIKYKAHIQQNTGLDWQKVKLSLSTTQPNRSNTQPTLNAWFLSLYQDYQRKKSYATAEKSMARAEPLTSAPTIVDKDQSALASFNLATSYEMAVSFAFDISVPYDVPSDGKQHSVTIKTLDVPCSYKHYTVPKVDQDAFLLAEIEDFESYNFLPGEAQIFLEGQYTGKTFLNPFVTEEQLSLSLGRDKNVVVKRERITAKSDKSFLGSNRTEVYNYKISVKNMKSKPITITIKDQYPLTNVAKIEVERLKHTSGGSVNEENGVVTWIEKVEPKSNKEFTISYKITRPKEWVIQGL